MKRLDWFNLKKYLCVMRKKILQFLANYIVFMLENSNSQEMFYDYYNMGCMVNAYAVELHDIYLN